MPAPSAEAREIIAALGLQPHPEGGHFVETFRDARTVDGRPWSTAIYYLLAEGEASHWHRVTDAAEMWLYHAGAPLALSLWQEDSPSIREHVLGADIRAGQRPQLLVAPNEWQAARSIGGWTLVSCTVAPGFVFEKMELAAPGWSPPIGGSNR